MSGAGKSSLAFDTLYAEGQRRYVETFSPYTRQFLAKLDKPDADRIEGIPPAIAVGQPHGRHSGRSTVGTITEIHDALASLYARAGQVICRNCGHTVEPASPATCLEPSRPCPRARATRSLSRWTCGRKPTRPLSYARCWRKASRASASMGSPGRSIDRRSTYPQMKRSRSSSIVWSAARIQPNAGPIRSRPHLQGAGPLPGHRPGKCRGLIFAAGGARGAGPITSSPSPTCSATTAPLGLCPVCEGFGRTMELDLGRIVPDPSRTIRAGALAPWSTPAYHDFLQALVDRSDQLDIPVDVPFESLTEDQVQRLLEGVLGVASRD